MSTAIRNILSLITLTIIFISSVWAQDSFQFSDGRSYLDVNGERRSYILHVPPQVSQSNESVPLVIVLHGGGGNATHGIRMTGFSELALREGFIVVYPDGSGRFRKIRTWNAVHCCSYAMNNNIDDVGFIDALIDELVFSENVDSNAVFVTGMSNGAMMTHRLGTELSHKLAGIAPVVGGLFGDEAIPNQSVPALMINGLLDNSIPYEGGLSQGRGASSWDGTPLEEVRFQGLFWAEANNCTTLQPDVVEAGQVVEINYDCPNSHPVQQLVINDNGHAWPGGERGSRRGDEPSGAIAATEVIWEFFSQQVE